MTKFYTALFLSLLLVDSAYAQLNITTSYTATQLAESLAGEGVTVSGATLDCPTIAFGKFACVDCNLGIDSGIILTTGKAIFAQGPNNTGSKSFDNGGAGDPDLNALPGVGTTHDACVLEFDMVPNYDTVSFDYVFGSDEYIEFVGSINDAFAFWISGPGIPTPKNIALIPGTIIPVTIDNVNLGSYPEYFVNNPSAGVALSDDYYIQYDGFTTVLAAFHAVTPCETYHLKLAVGDESDHLYDSGVFLKAHSLSTDYVAAFIYPDAGIGIGAVYCTAGPDPIPLLDPGATPGVFSATPAGLIIDPITGVIDVSASLPGNYIVSNTIIYGCDPDTLVASSPITITEPELPTFSYVGSPFCSNDSDPAPVFAAGAVGGTFSSTPGLSINAISGIIDLSASLPGTYTITNAIAAAGGCPAVSATSTITINPIYIIPVSVNLCSGETYTLADGTIVAVSGLYTVIVPAVTGCDSTINTTVTVHPDYALSTAGAICDDALYTLPDGTTTNVAGIYVTNLLTAAGCDSIITTTLTVSPTYAVAVDADICTGESYTLPDGSVVAVGGIYTTTLAAVSGCDSIITTTLNVVSTLIVNENDSICVGDTFVFPDGTSTSTAGVYSFNYISVGGCDSIINITLTVNDNPVIDFTDAIVCLEDGSLILNATPTGGIYSGYDVSGNVFDIEAAGVGGPYAITYTYTNAQGCSASLLANITVAQNYANAYGDTTIYAGQIAPLTSDAGGDYSWFPPAGLNCIDCPNPNSAAPYTITYTLTSTDAQGCIATDNVTVNVLPEPEQVVYIPNTFTPNNDLLNDYFFVYGATIQSIKYMRIFDRWGELIYSVENIDATATSKGWDGSYAGKLLQNGVYAYVIELEYTNGKTDLKKGNITLLR